MLLQQDAASNSVAKAIEHAFGQALSSKISAELGANLVEQVQVTSYQKFASLIASARLTVLVRGTPTDS